MPKLIIMQGLPGSGKTTEAERIVKVTGNTIRLNKDILRTMLHFDKFTGPNEKKTHKAAKELARIFLKECNVIVDDTNLNPKTMQSWLNLANEVGVNIEVIDMETSIAECIKNDEKREKKVGASIIVAMALQGGIYPKPEKPVIICDIDGTLANIDHRLHFVKDLAPGKKKDWKSFFEECPRDAQRTDIMKMVMKYYHDGHPVFIMSGRSDQYRPQTETWLFEKFAGEFGCIPYEAVLMRKAFDHRPDTDVKRDMLNRYFPDKSWIHTVIDDRPSVIRMWREEGLNVIDVGSGIEF